MYFMAVYLFFSKSCDVCKKNKKTPLFSLRHCWLLTRRPPRGQSGVSVRDQGHGASNGSGTPLLSVAMATIDAA